MIPEHTKEAIDNYVESGWQGGSFVTAFLSNDLRGAVGAADEINRYKIFEIACYCHNAIPANCWGIPEIVKQWIASGGRKGQAEKWQKEHDGEVNAQR